MTQCFKDHDCDEQPLNRSTRPVSECEGQVVRLYGCQTHVTEVPILTCEGIWRIYQREAEEIVAPGGTLIANPVERNRAINAAYARLWLHEPRFQWAGLAAFASKQVGCGLLHAAASIDGIQVEYDAKQKLRSIRRASGLFTPGKMQEQAQALHDYQQAGSNNPIPSMDIRTEGEPLSLMQQQFQHVYEMMALGNTTLFLDIFPLHAFYAKRGFKELKTCGENRASIYGHPKFPVLWPVGQEALTFGKSYLEILQAFEAIEAGDIAKSVKFFAYHEQQNILQPAIYEDRQLVALLRGNHASTLPISPPAWPRPSN